MRKTIRLLSMMLLVCLLLSVMAMPTLALEKAADTDNTTPEYAQILNDDEWQILALTNRARFANGLDPLTAFASIQSVCDIREEELAEVYSHTRPNGEPCFSLLAPRSAFLIILPVKILRRVQSIPRQPEFLKPG